MNFLILFDNSFLNDYSKDFFDVAKNKANTLKDTLKCDMKIMEENDLSSISIEAYLKKIYDISDGYENIIYIPCNMPLIDVQETIELSNIHKDNISYYSYGENYPKGVVPFIIRRASFERLFSLIKDRDIKPSIDAISKMVFIDPNFFEIEMLISKYDMRYYRLSLFAEDKRSAALVSRLLECEDYDDMVKRIKETPEIRRTFPAYVELDISGVQNVRYIENVYYKENDKNMTLKEFENIYVKLSDFCGDFHISIGSFCEPLLNGDVFDMLRYATDRKNVNVYLETNATLLDEKKAKILLSLQKERDNLYVIIRLDTIDDNIYKTIYLNGDLKTTLSNIDYYLIREPKNTYLQIVKQKSNFDNIASYYKYFEKYGVDIIMQKYSTYRGLFTDNRVGDMSPLVNVGCWHLARDLFIDVCGNIYVCKYDIKKEILLGNIFIDSLENIWKKGEAYYIDNVFKKLDFCNKCDEWYLYNF